MTAPLYVLAALAITTGIAVAHFLPGRALAPFSFASAARRHGFTAVMISVGAPALPFGSKNARRPFAA